MSETNGVERMVSPELDSDGYPTEETLEAIKAWPVLEYRDLMEFIKPIFEDYGRVELRDIDDTYEVATGGWSGCEDAINAMQRNFAFWGICWMLSKRGGYYEFKVKG